MRAGEVMTPGVATVREDAPINDVIALMETRHVSGVPVVDAYGRLVGIVTEGDLLRRVETGTATHHRAGWLDLLLGPGRSAGEYVRTHSRRVGDLMTRDLATVEESTPLEDVVALMERKHVKRVPVVRDDELVGIVSRADLVRTLGHALKAAAMGGTVDALLRERLQANLGKESWFPARDVSIAVKNGVVTLEGIVSDERTRAALRVAAQNVAGIATVDDQMVWVNPAAVGLLL